ncbi:MAG: SIS domain-containing protein [Candidatus Sericytochromatia bacterium]|nr:SIS domain-containing protein [Candidatus Sericytochromatia bacterium]
MEGVHESFMCSRIEASLAVKQAFLDDPSLLEQLSLVVESCVRSLAVGGKLIFAGNGGSFADARHLLAEFTSRFNMKRRPLASLVLGANSSAISVIGNDYGYDQVFALCSLPEFLGQRAARGAFRFESDLVAGSPARQAIIVPMDFGAPVRYPDFRESHARTTPDLCGFHLPHRASNRSVRSAGRHATHRRQRWRLHSRCAAPGGKAALAMRAHLRVRVGSVVRKPGGGPAKHGALGWVIRRPPASS